MSLRAMLLLATAHAWPSRPYRDAEPEPEPPRRPPPPGPDAVACPRCHAAPGQPCDRRTLGRHPYHAARVAALEKP